MTSQVVEGTWIRTGGYERLRGEWVKTDSSWVVAFSTDTFRFIDKCAIKMPVLNQTKEVAHLIFGERTISHFYKMQIEAGVQEIVLNLKTSFFPILMKY